MSGVGLVAEVTAGLTLHLLLPLRQAYVRLVSATVWGRALSLSTPGSLDCALLLLLFAAAAAGQKQCESCAPESCAWLLKWQ